MYWIDKTQGLAGSKVLTLSSTTFISHILSSCSGKHWRLRSDKNEQYLRVKHSITHPQYKPSTFENDVALLELLESPMLNNFVMPICLPEEPSQEGTFPHPQFHLCRAAGPLAGSFLPGLVSQLMVSASPAASHPDRTVSEEAQIATRGRPMDPRK
jgi:hypothetical protein